MTDEWDNKAHMTLRTKIVLKILLLMIKVISPYRFAHQFEPEIKNLAEEISKIDT